MRVTYTALILLLFSVCLLFGQEKLLTPELILSIKPVTDVQLSPDGGRILFHSSRPRSTDDKPGDSWGEIWIIWQTGDAPSRLTHNNRTDRHARWSPDGKTIAFISTRGTLETAQIYLISLAGGEARQLTSVENSVRSFKWSPDGRTIAFTMEDAKTERDLQSEREGRDWIVADENYKHIRLYGVRVPAGEVWKITNDELSIWDFDWSPEGKRLVVQATRTPKVDDQYMNSMLMTVDAEGNVPKLLVKTEGKLESPRWSPDGKTIAWLGATKRSDPYAGSVYVVSTAGAEPRERGEPVNLTPEYEGSATFLTWLPKSNYLVFRAIERQQNALRKIDLSTQRISPILTEPIIYNEVSFSADGKLMALAANSPSHPNDVFLGETRSGTAKRMTKFNPQLDGITLAEQEVVIWNANDGLEVEGILVKPIGYVKGQRYPLFVQFHGGPEAADVNGWLGLVTRWGQMLAARGIAVLYPNYRGSIGRGVAFSEANQKDMMGSEFDDVLAGIDHFAREGIVDENFIGLGGGSYGGYAAGWAATKHSHRFKLAVSWMGVSNRVSKVGTADNHTEEMIVHWTVDMYDDFELYWDRSPLKHIQNAQTPTLILHGEKDARVPVSQGRELYTALKWKGVPVEFVVYPRERHGITERAHQEDFLNRILIWTEKYLRASFTDRLLHEHDGEQSE